MSFVELSRNDDACNLTLMGRTIRSLLLNVLIHEVEECLLLDDEPFFDPHALDGPI